MADLLGLLKGELAGEVATLALGGIVERLEERHLAFVRALDRAPPSAVDFGTVKQTEAHAQGLLLDVIARTVGRFPTASTEDANGRARLLAPLLLQNDRIRDTYRRRRRVVDVNPLSGEEELDENAGSAAPADGEAAPVASEQQP